jgi:hypothetical protein
MISSTASGMSNYTVQVDHIVFGRDDKRGEDGAVWYLLLTPCTDDPCTHACTAHPGMRHHYERQAFRLGGFGHRLDATDEEKQTDCANVWGWDGNRAAPTLTPSYLAKKGRPYVMHSFLKAGRLDLCGDSTVTHAPNPQPCVMPVES